MSRTAQISRVTGETNIDVTLELDGSGTVQTNTGIPFFNHMLSAFGRHGLFDVSIQAVGDIDVDFHHTVEDTGIVLGQAFREALGDKSSITRFANVCIPMDETLVLAAVDISGRGELYWDVPIGPDKVGDFDCELGHEFFAGFARDAGVTLHIREICGENAHHILEAAFKAAGRAMRLACEFDERVVGVPSTKGSLS